MQADLLGQGLELMLYGMGTVVFFLVLLVLATTAMSRCITHFFPQSLSETRASAVAGAGGGGEDSGVDDPNVIVAISAAIHQHRRNRK